MDNNLLETITKKQSERYEFRRRYLKHDHSPFNKREQKALKKWNEENDAYHQILAHVGHKILQQNYSEYSSFNPKKLMQTIIKMDNSEAMLENIASQETRMYQIKALRFSMANNTLITVIEKCFHGFKYVGLGSCLLPLMPLTQLQKIDVVFASLLIVAGTVFQALQIQKNDSSQIEKRLKLSKIKEDMRVTGDEIISRENTLFALSAFKKNDAKYFSEPDVADCAEFLLLDMNKAQAGPQIKD